jgi:hypothetical protein
MLSDRGGIFKELSCRVCRKVKGEVYLHSVDTFEKLHKSLCVLTFSPFRWQRSRMFIGRTLKLAEKSRTHTHTQCRDFIARAFCKHALSLSPPRYTPHANKACINCESDENIINRNGVEKSWAAGRQTQTCTNSHSCG